MKRLTRDEFDSALHKGLGRAVLHVQEFGIQDLTDVLENAVLHNLVYDLQCEGGRTDWLFSILKNTNDLAYYEEFLFRNLPDIRNCCDLWQAFDLLFHFAKNGSERARAALYSEFDKQSFNGDWSWSERIVDLDGIEGFFYVAERVGKFRDVEEFWRGKFLLNSIKERFGKETVDKAIEERLKTSEDLKFYLDTIVERKRPKVESREQLFERMRNQSPIQEIRRDIENGKGNITRYAVFGYHALDKDILEIYTQLKFEKRIPQLVRLLWVFRNRALLEINDGLISYAFAEDDEVSKAAIRALSNSRHPNLHSLALTIMRDAKWERAASAFELLIRNYEESDIKAINNVLERIPMGIDRETIHHIVLTLKELCEENDSSEMTSVLNWIYENSPCMNCRAAAVRRLVKNRSLSRIMLNECMVDGMEPIREIVGGESPIT